MKNGHYDKIIQYNNVGHLATGSSITSFILICVFFILDGLALDAWLGMNDIDTEGSLKWSNNQTVSFMGYISNQELKDCVAMRRKNFYTMHWSIQSCNNLNAFICEKPVV